MCDTEHMLECSGDTGNSNSLSNVQISDSDFDEIVEQFQVTDARCHVCKYNFCERSNQLKKLSLRKRKERNEH